MKKRVAVVLFAGISALFLSGCATTGKNVTRENDNLKIQIQNLETQIQKKDAEIDSLRRSLSSTTEEKYAAANPRAFNRGLLSERPSGKDIQIALKNAGFDPGAADGKLGKKTRQAIRDFQKANGLDVDGKVGRRTWEVLGPYLAQAASN